MGKRYSPSNKFNIALVIFLLFAGTFVSFILTGFSALLGLWLVPPYAGMVLVFIAAWGIYLVQKFSVKYSKNRNIFLARLIIFCSSLLTSLFHMACIPTIMLSLESAIKDVNLSVSLGQLWDIFGGALFLLLTQPGQVINAFFESTPWTIYFVIILLSNILVPQLAAEQASKPFSEETHQWMQEVLSLGRFEPFPDREQHTLVSAMKREDIYPFIERPGCTAQDPVDYGQLVFYKVGNMHSGYVGVRQYHQIRSSNGEFIPNKYQMIEFIPPIQVGPVYALKLETAVNSSSMTGGRFPSQREEEDGYTLYRTASEAADFQYNTAKRNPKETDYSQFRPQSLEFNKDKDSNDDYIPYNPALHPSWDNSPYDTDYEEDEDDDY